MFGRSYLPHQQDGHFYEPDQSPAENAVKNSTLTVLSMQLAFL